MGDHGIALAMPWVFMALPSVLMTPTAMACHDENAPWQCALVAWHSGGAVPRAVECHAPSWRRQGHAMLWQSSWRTPGNVMGFRSTVMVLP